GNGLLRAEGDTWLKQRRLMQPGFHKQRIRGYADTMLALAEKSAARLEHGETVDFSDLQSSLTLYIAVTTMFGQTSESDGTDVADHLSGIMDRFEDALYLVEPDWWPSSGQRRYRRSVAALDRIIARYIDTRRAAPSDDVLSMLLEMRDDHGQPMSP